MTTYKFYIKEDADLTKYGFKESSPRKNEYVYKGENGYGRAVMWVDKGRVLHFSGANNDHIKVFMDMVLDGIVKAEKWWRKDKKQLQVFVTPEEKQMLDEWRKSNEKDV